MHIQFQIAGILLCFALSAFFSGMEIGALSVRRARLLHYVRDGIKAAERLESYLLHSQKFIGTILVGNNLANVILSTLSAALGQQLFAGSSSRQSVWAVFMAVMVLIFCEYIPKLFFESRPLRRTLPLVSMFSIFDTLLSPVTRLILFITQWVIPSKRHKSGNKFLITREYLHDVVGNKENGSNITAIERLMIKRVLVLQSLFAAEIMTPLEHVYRVQKNTLLKECYSIVRSCGHVRLPVFSEDGRTCVGVLHALDVLAFAPDPETTRAGRYMQPPFFVNYDVHADDLLPLMRRNRQPMAFVRNKQAEVIGIVTEASILGLLTADLKKA